MTDRPTARHLNVVHSQDDLQWLAGFARQENVSTAALTSHAIWLLRMWEQTIKGAIIEVLEGIDALRREHDQELRQLRHYRERRLVNSAWAGLTPLYGAKIARLLALAVSTDSEAEASGALAKARALHTQRH